MYTYSLTANRSTILRSDGATISVNSKNRDYVEYLNWVAAGNVATGAPLGAAITPKTSIPTALGASTLHTSSLDQSKVSKAAEINQACQNAILGGFQSDALGTVYTYPAQITDQVNLNTKVNAAIVAMSSLSWAPGAPHKFGETIVPPTKQVFTCTREGVSSSNPQNWNVELGATVDDGTCNWQIWITHFWCQNDQGVWALNVHTAPQIRQVGLAAAAALNFATWKNSTLQMQIQAATDVESVQCINWAS